MEFAKSREVLFGKKRELVEKHDKGNRPQVVGSNTPSEEDLLFHTKQFGDHNPEVLQGTVWFVLSLHFGFRARDESRKLSWGDIVRENDPHGGEVLVWKAERGSKTRHGDGTHQRAFNPTMQATNNELCSVKLFKKFSAHRPKKMKHPDSPFFLAINHKRKARATNMVLQQSSRKECDWKIPPESSQSRRTAWEYQQPLRKENLHIPPNGCRPPGELCSRTQRL